MEVHAGWIAGLVLVVLWTIEASAPGLLVPAQPVRQRARHLVLGLMNALVSAIIVSIFVFADAWAQYAGAGVLRWTALPLWVEIAAAFVLLDLWQYASHVLAHHVPVLWRFHAVHHNADRLDATVAMRFHLVEVAWSGLMMIPFALAMGIPVGHVAVYNALLVSASLFHHANIAVPSRIERVLGAVIVTPRMHWVHHSRWTPETNSNYGAVLPVWDRLFGTYRRREHAEAIDIGLDGYSEREIEELTGMLLAPFGASVSGYGEAPADESAESGALPTAASGCR